MISASPSATPSWSKACSVASATVLPATSTHSTRYRAFLLRFERDRFWALGAGGWLCPLRPPEPALPFGDFRPFVVPRPFDPVPGLGGTVPLASDVPSVAVDFRRCGGFGAGFAGSGFSFSSLAEPISRSTATGATMPVRNITSCVPIRMAEDTTM
jgi:hypothetical protein